MPYRISSGGDLEVVVLSEAHGLLAVTISQDLYKVLGNQPGEIAMFHTPACLDLFLIRADEFISEARNNVAVPGVERNLSLLAGVKWLGQRLPLGERRQLEDSVAELDEWLLTIDPVKFWCPQVDQVVAFEVERRKILNIGANTRKHSALRLTAIADKLERLCKSGGYEPLESEIYGVLEALLENLNGYFLYHSSRLAELLGNLFLAINSDIRRRYEGSGRTNDAREIVHVEGVTSGYFRDVYASTLVSKNYAESRIVDLTPSTSEHYRRKYDFGFGVEPLVAG